MPTDLEAFERSCRDTSRQLRRLPAEVRKAIAAPAQTDVASPLADRIRSSFAGPYRAVLAAGTKARKDADPTVVVGGARPVVRGGASVRQLVYGNEWGGGRRVTPTTRRTRHGGRSTSYRLRSTQQFGQPRSSIIPTLKDNAGRVIDAWAQIVTDTIERTLPRG
jgi:hypothetical protein